MKSIMTSGQKRRSPRASRTPSLQEFFQSNNGNKKSKQQMFSESISRAPSKYNIHAEEWGNCFHQSPTYLTDDGNSWFLHVKKWWPTPSQEGFDKEWNLHPSKRHSLQVFGRTVQEKRWSQSWGISYAYSGATNQARSLKKDTMVHTLIDKANELLTNTTAAGSNNSKSRNNQNPYNGCLQNWYTPEDTIGLHSDDEKSMCRDYPIFSLSWGGTRRFLLKRKEKTNIPHQDTVELWLEDGDLLLMGGTCQETHKHEIPKRRVTKDPSTSNRINWTIRAFADLRKK